MSAHRYANWTARALAVVLPLFWASHAGNVSHRPRNVLVVTFDTTRADVLAAYGGNKVETPALDRLAREGVVFEQATSPVPLTLPAHASLLTGLFPPHHGVRDNVDSPLGDACTTLAELLRASGARTAAFVGSAVVDGRRGLAQGFDIYSDGQRENRNPRLRRPANVVVDEAASWIARQQTSPFLAWVHLYDAHAPYSLPQPYRTMYEDAPYLGSIAFMDAQLQRLLTLLDDRQLTEHTVVIVAADHGESLGDHGEDGHGIFVYQSTLHVPMIIRAPGTPARRVPEVVRIVDVMPTVLDILRVSPPPMDGVSLVPLMMGKVEHVDLDAYSESLYPRRFGWGGLHALRAGRFKFVSAPRPELYDLEKDPGERRNIYSQRPDLAAVMGAALERMSVPTAVIHDSSDVDPEAAERIAALGYVGHARGVGDAHSDDSLDDPKDCIGAYNSILRQGGTSPVELSPAAPAGHGGDEERAKWIRAVRVLNATSTSSRSPFEHALSCSSGAAVSPQPSELRASAFALDPPRNRTPLGASR